MKVWSIGVLVTLAAGCSGLPLEPASYRESTVVVSGPSIVGTPVAGTQPLVASPVPDPAPEPPSRTPSPQPGAPPPAEPTKPIDPIDVGPCGAGSCEPTVVSCPAGLEPIMVDGEITCKAPEVFTCPAGKQPVFGETLTCE
jgi:hypothetical protein